MALTPKIRDSGSHPALQADPYYSGMEDGVAYSAIQADPYYTVTVVRQGNTFILHNKRSGEGRMMTINREMIIDMRLAFNPLSNLAEGILGIAPSYPTRLLDMIWYMLGFGGVVGRTDYIDASFASNLKKAQN